MVSGLCVRLGSLIRKMPVLWQIEIVHVLVIVQVAILIRKFSNHIVSQIYAAYIRNAMQAFDKLGVDLSSIFG